MRQLLDRLLRRWFPSRPPQAPAPWQHGPAHRYGPHEPAYRERGASTVTALIWLALYILGGLAAVALLVTGMHP